MKRTLFLRIFAGYLAIVLVLAVTIPLVTFGLIREDHLASTRQDLLNLGLAAQDSLLPLLKRPLELERQVTGLGQRLDRRITLVATDGRVIADSELAAREMENHRDRPEVAAALAGRPGASTRYSTTLNQDMLYVAQPLVENKRQIGAIRLSCDLAGINDLLGRIRLQIFKVSLAVVLAVLLASLVIAGLIARPVHALSRAARQVAGGDFGVRVKARQRGEVGELCASFNHMTERLEQTFADLSSTKQTLESIIAAIPDALLVVDAGGRVQLLNQSARELSGLNVDPVGRYHWEVLRIADIDQGLSAAKPQSREVRLGEASYLMSVAQIGSSASRVILLTDISELKRLELIKRDLVVNVSHELRTPLTAIKGFTETMLSDGSFEPEYLEIIARHTERLINIVGDLMNLAELEQGGGPALELARIDLGNLLAGLVKAFGARAATKGLELSLAVPAEPVMIMADAFRLEQLFSNLIDNALKYTEQGWVRVELQNDPAGVRVRVADSGPGIAPEHLSRIFERFYVVDKSRSRQLGGTGLGLSIARHIAGLHGAALTVTSAPGQGSGFEFRLPPV